MATAAAVTATTFTVVVTMVVIVAVATAATVVTVIMIVVMTVRTVNVAMSQLFFGRFADRNNFNVELQVLASQHVVAINNNVVVFNFGDFNRYWTLVGFCQEAHANLQLINAHKYIFRNTLNQILIVLTVSVVCANSNIEFIANFMTVQRGFQAGDQGTVTMQVVQRRTHRRLINQYTVFCTYLIGQADHQVFCYFHDIS
ncbi:hypothetical protein DR73_4149 [Enterobacteriaceae bacterium ATCC 29904]|nr:hypothetical protein DR73_4149 [Enterobacteriaceae bacterium ATCC 29904]